MSSSAFPGWYIEFQTALLRQAPRPEQVDQMIAEGWVNNQKALKENLYDCLLPKPRCGLADDAEKIVKALVDAVKQDGGDEEDVLMLLGEDSKMLQEVVKSVSSKTRVVFKGFVDIDNSKTFDERMEKYGLMCSSIIQNYSVEPSDGHDRVEFSVLRFGKWTEVLDVEKQMEELGLEHTSLEEAIAFGDRYGHIVHKYRGVMSLGSCKFSETDSPEEARRSLAFFGHRGYKTYHEAVTVFWETLGSLTLGTHQFFARAGRGTCVLCKKKS
ncbi:MAG TPA: hypothetical protein P5274_00805 [Candidatus Paceibacterota bacterium]|nr:hypothetical protein [Candidatus Paceibacterota bacterium]